MEPEEEISDGTVRYHAGRGNRVRHNYHAWGVVMSLWRHYHAEVRFSEFTAEIELLVTNSH